MSNYINKLNPYQLNWVVDLQLEPQKVAYRAVFKPQLDIGLVDRAHRGPSLLLS